MTPVKRFGSLSTMEKILTLLNIPIWKKKKEKMPEMLALGIFLSFIIFEAVFKNGICKRVRVFSVVLNASRCFI